MEEGTEEWEAWVEIFCCDRAILRWGVNDATNHVQCRPLVNVILASRMVLFNLWSISHGVSPGSIVISLNPMTNWFSDFGQPNSLLNASCIAASPSFRWSVEFFMYHVSARSWSALNNVAFLMFSSILPCAAHIEFITNQNRLVSSFHIP